MGGGPGGSKDGSTWAGFLVMAFAVVGLVGGMGTYAAQIPYERAFARSQALDQALAAATAPDASARLAALRPALDDSADHIISAANQPLPDMRALVATERARMFAAFETDAHDTGRRVRLALAGFTATGALFGVLVLNLARRNSAGG
jgi:hypothetical protein